MGTRDKRVDAFIAKSADFAKPILTSLRETVHASCPDCEEAIKWGFPFFLLDGKPLCFMNAFTKHAGFGFWRGRLVLDPGEDRRDAMGNFGRLTTVKDIPPRAVLTKYIKRAAAVTREGNAPAAKKKVAKPEPKAPAAFVAALKRTKGAWAHWQAFPPSHRREYLTWILGAKQNATRERRMATAVAQVAEGKSQNWKYAAR